jgi:hypothetical protein
VRAVRQSRFARLRLAGERTRDLIESCIAYLDGSFVTAKEHPRDFDVCWEPAGVVLDRLDAELKDFSDKCAAQKTRYGGELYPADWAAEPGGMRFRDYFQRDAISKQAKGIIAVDVAGLA